MTRKSINITNEDDVKQWQRIKLAEMNFRDNPDLGDLELFREMMDLYEQCEDDLRGN